MPSEFGSHAPRHDVTDTHILFPLIEHHRFAQTGESKLRRVVCGPARKRILPSQATHIDDVTAPAGSESEQSFTRTVEHSREICFDRILPILYGKLCDRAEHPDTGVVNQDIEAAEVFIDELEKCSNLFIVPYIGSFSCDFTARLRAQSVHSFIHSFLSTPEN